MPKYKSLEGCNSKLYEIDFFRRNKMKKYEFSKNINSDLLKLFMNNSDKVIFFSNKTIIAKNMNESVLESYTYISSNAAKFNAYQITVVSENLPDNLTEFNDVLLSVIIDYVFTYKKITIFSLEDILNKLIFRGSVLHKNSTKTSIVL